MERNALPPGFDGLERLVEDWALPTEPARYAKRLATPLAQLRVFHEVIYPCMEAVLQHLAQVPGSDARGAAPADRNLFYLALAYFEASHPVDLRWKGSDLDVAFPADRIVYSGPSSSAD